MKTLRFIGMAIVAIIMSVNFVACDDDDKEEGGQTSQAKPLISITRSNYDSESDWVYTYSDGKLISGKNNKNYSFTIKYGNKLGVEYNDDGSIGKYVDIILNDKGYITSYTHQTDYYGPLQDYEKYTFEYDSEGHLIATKKFDVDEDCLGHEYHFTYSNGNIIKAVIDNDYSYSFTSASIPNVSGILCDALREAEFPHLDDKGEGFLYYAGLLGKPIQNLVSKLIRYDGKTIEYTYQFDKDNKVTECSFEAEGKAISISYGY